MLNLVNMPSLYDYQFNKKYKFINKLDLSTISMQVFHPEDL